MREALLVVIIGGICMAALVRPRIGLYGYIWFTLMRPDYFAWSSGGRFPYAAALAIATALGSLHYARDYVRVFKNPIARLLVILQLPLLASVLFAVTPELTYQPYLDYVSFIPIVLLIPVLITTENDLKVLFVTIAASLGFIGLKFGLFGLRAGGVHLYEGYAGLDNNSVAANLAMAVPVLWYSRSLFSSRACRAAIVVTLMATMAAVVMTKSRGGSLAMATTLLLIAATAKRRVLVLLLLLAIAAPSVYMFRDQYFARMSTLAAPAEDTSASSRFVLGRAAFRMWLDYPIFGVGFGNQVFLELENYYLEVDYSKALKAHVGYLQVLVDSGLLAFAAWAGLLFSTIVRMFRSARRAKRAGDPLYTIPLALGTSLIAFAQYNLTGAKERDSILYIFLMAAAAWWTLQSHRRGIAGKAADENGVPVEETA